MRLIVRCVIVLAAILLIGGGPFMPPAATLNAQSDEPAGRIVFDGGDGLYSIRADGTDLRQLADSANFDLLGRNPRWSPDGRQVLMTARQNLLLDVYVIDADGSNLRALTEGYPQSNGDWSPDGRRIVFQCHPDNTTAEVPIDSWSEICMMDADGSNVRRLTYTQDRYIHNLGPRWSPDGAHIIYVSEGNLVFGGNIWIMNADGSNQRRLFQSTGGRDRIRTFFLHWSPDGSQIMFTSSRDTPDPSLEAYQQNHDIYVIDADGSNLRRLTSSPSWDSGQGWSPDGRWILMFSNNDQEAGRGYYIVPADARDLDTAPRQRLTTHERGGLEGSADWRITPEDLAASVPGPAGFRVENGSPIQPAPDDAPEGLIIYNLVDQYGLGPPVTIRPDGSDLTEILSAARLPHDVNLSPDGNEYIYVGWPQAPPTDYEILRRSATDTMGPQHMLTDNDRPDEMPAWSPDGTLIAYTCSEAGSRSNPIYDICVLNPADYSRRNLTNTPDINEQEPAWSPDGTQIAYTVYAPNMVETDLWVMNAGGSSQTPLLASEFQARGAVWSADGRHILFSATRGSNLRVATQDVFVLEVGSDTPYQLTTHPGQDWAVGWSNDGAWVLFASTREANPDDAPGIQTIRLYLLRLADGSVYRVTEHTERAEFVNWWQPAPAVPLIVSAEAAPAGPVVTGDPTGRLVFAYRETRSDIATLYTVNVDGRDLNQVLRIPGNDVSPSWSPDGTQIAFASSRLEASTIFVVDANGDNLRQVSDAWAVARMPDWSPGGLIIFQCLLDEPYSTRELCTVDPASDDVMAERRLTDHAGYEENPQWSPDGSQIVYQAANNDGGTSLFVMDADGGNVRQLTDSTAYDDANPQWSPDGALIMFTSNRGTDLDLPWYEQENDVFIINADGTDLRALPLALGSEVGHGWSPDGGWIVLTAGENMGANHTALYLQRAAAAFMPGADVLPVEVNLDGLFYNVAWGVAAGQ